MKKQKIFNLNKDFFYNDNLTIIAGPCAIESKEMCFEVAVKMKKLCNKYGVNYVFKSSFDKANRTSSESKRGLGVEEGLKIFEAIKKEINVPILTDVHEPSQCKKVAPYVDILQIPAFLSRQTDLLEAAGLTGKIVNIKKGQFMAPNDILNSAKKVEKYNKKILLCERGVSFGYNNLVVDFTGILEMNKSIYSIVFDATHSVQKPSSKGTSTGGNREYVVPLIKAALSIGVKNIFIEVHTNPKEAISDGENQLFLSSMESILEEVSDLYKFINKEV